MRDLEATLADLHEHGVLRRIWSRDHTVWKPGSQEITDRLGWLKVTDLMRPQVTSLEEFADEVRKEGFRHVVLMGMGGSSLGPEVLRQAFGPSNGHPALIVLDSIIPSRVKQVSEAIDPDRTLFLVSSKSGGTVEPNSLYKHFRYLVEQSAGKEAAGRNFVAITDSGTSLDGLAQEQGFRRVFRNPPDLGGRYSVLTYFGLVPASLMGLDVEAILDRADRMREDCGPGVPVDDNPGARLGAVMGSQALDGRDKLTFVTSHTLDAFGLWAEQLIAESTGKEGRGIVPVAGEPLLGPASYGDDRLFVYLRLDGDDNGANDAAVAEIESSGQPVVRLELGDRYDLGAEFFRWEFATAVAGSILAINPFDQPDVELAKRQTDMALQEYQKTGRLPHEEAQDGIVDLLGEAEGGRYLSIMAFLRSTPDIERSLAELRRVVMGQHRIATTLGYGPRFLHSTGQLHKGGPDGGLFLQLTVDHAEDVPIPGEPYTFGILAEAQALGDLRALRERHRRVVRVHLGPEGGAEIARLAEL